MANLPELVQYDAGIYQIETSDAVLGGVNGTTNTPLKNLANRTAYLKKHVDDLESGTTVPTGIATQTWVTGELNKLDNKASVRAATTANITLSGTQTIDGVSVTTGDRVLVKNQTTGSQNGIYVVSASAWTRSTDADLSAEVTSGLQVFVSEGTAQASTIWKLTTVDPITLGTTSLTFLDVTSGYAPLASPVFTGNPTAPTAAQFDNDTSLATTEFVQRALGNLSGQVSVSTTSTLSAANVGKRININASGLTVTLPALSSVPVGSVYWIRCSVGPVTIAKQSGDSLQVGATLPSTFTLQQSEFAIIIAGSASWNVEGGDAELAYSPRFDSSLATSGYQKLPTGLIIQWGAFTSSSSAGANVTVTFPIAFPTGAMGISLATNAATTATQSAWFSGLSTTGFSGRSNATSNDIRWIAIGY